MSRLFDAAEGTAAYANLQSARPKLHSFAISAEKLRLNTQINVN